MALFMARHLWYLLRSFYVRNYGARAVVVMDNLPVHKIELIEQKIQAVGARVIYLSPYSPDFNPIELWWSQLKSLMHSLCSHYHLYD